jgi:hypothetical protein
MKYKAVAKASENGFRKGYVVFFFCFILFLAGCGGGGEGGSAAGVALLASAPAVQYLPESSADDDYSVTGELHVLPGKTYKYKYLHIYGGGKLIFDDVVSETANLSLVEAVLYHLKKFFTGGAAKTETHFWAASILVEKEGSLIAGSEDKPFQSILVLHLYGSNAETKGIECKTTDLPNAYCGVPAGKWDDHEINYEKLPDEKLANDHLAYFGRKVLGVSYGGSLQLFGAKGMTKGSIAEAGAASGKSWARLDVTAAAGNTSITLDRAVDWEVGDQIVITTTDFLPTHSEQRQIKSISVGGGQSTITLTEGLTYRHNGKAYDLSQYDLSAQGITRKTVETRAAVALLTRNIRIVSAGKTVGEELPAATNTDANRYFGAQTLIRQGFSKVQIQGVEFYQMGQGGMLAHSPLLFLGVFDAPADGSAFVRDCSIWDSMTRWIEVRGAQNLLIERNVGFKSIGHGYMSAGFEANNIYRANIGIYARPALVYPDNPRNVPGVYAQTGWSDEGEADKNMATQSDYVTPAVFLIANPYNTYEHNMAVGAGACGSCYWIVPGHAVGPPDYAPGGYVSAMQKDSHAPLYSFMGNFCSTAQYSLITVGGISSCNGITADPTYTAKQLLLPAQKEMDTYNSLNINTASNYKPKLLGDNCTKGDTAGCTVTVIENYTSSFHWGQHNWSAIWLRNDWFLFTDSALTDIMGPGLTMVSGGSYEQVKNGYWALTRRSVFVGQTQVGNDFATASGPKVNSVTGLACEGKTGSYCLFHDEGISIPTVNFANYQRFYNIYDGPVYQEANAFLNIRPTRLAKILDSEYIYGLKTNDANRSLGIPKAKENAKDNLYQKDDCILTNAAIAWKQPNGFYYPAAFHSKNLFFDKVDLRHFVLVPLFVEGTQITDSDKVSKQYCTSSGDIFSDFTDVDRQTELNDDDGSLTGIKGIGDNGSISVNDDTFYYLPKMTYECDSGKTSLQVPYDHVTANIFPRCLSSECLPVQGVSPCKECVPCSQSLSQKTGCGWDKSCGSPGCNGVPLYRQYLNTSEPVGYRQMMRMLGKGVGQRVNLVTNQGKYYIDTAQDSLNVPRKENADSVNNKQNDFEAGHTYYVYLLYAKDNTKVTFQIYAGKNAPGVKDSLKMVRLGTARPDGVVLVDPFVFSVKNEWPWASPKYTADTGILEVTIDMSQFAQDFANGKKEACKPSSVCKWNDASSTCGCAQTKGKDINYTCEPSVCQWSTKAMECPAGGCIGFQFTLPSTFVADNVSHRPAAEVFPSSWNINWQDYLVGDIAGSCKYTSDPSFP